MSEELETVILEFAKDVYPIDEKTEVVILHNRGASVTLEGGGTRILKLQDKLEGFWAEYVPENNKIYIVRGDTKWVKDKNSGYLRLQK